MSLSLQHELHKRLPFELPEQEAYLNLLRSASRLSVEFERLFKSHGLSEPTYNILRILRGAGEAGRMCHELAEHMVAPVPDVTRLIDRLEASGFAARRRCDRDRRVVHVSITEDGRAILARLDQPVLDLHRRQLGHMTADELRTLSDLLAKARAPHVGHSSGGTH
jgi:DNA-binding MarR family transcriptional regulator